MKKKKTALSLALLCVIIISLLCGCGSSGADKSAFETTSAASAPTADYAPMPYPEEGDYNGFVENEASDSAQVGGSGQDSSLPQNAKLIYRVYMDIETLNYEDSVSGLEKLCADMGGYVEYSNVNGIRYGSTSLRSSSFTLRIPTEKLDEFEGACGGIGNVYSSQREVENATARYVDLSARLDAYETEQTRLLELLEQAVSLDDVISLNARLSEVRYEIDSIKSSLRDIDSLVSYSTVTISLREVEETSTVYDVPRTFGEKVSQAFSNGFESFKRFLSGMGVFFLGELPFVLLMILLVLIPVALVVFVVVIIVRSIKKKKAAKSGGAKAEFNNDKKSGE